MSKTTTKRAARPQAYKVFQPPITREEARSYLKAEITDEAWTAICSAFAQYGFILDSLNASRASKSKDPAKASWHERQKGTVKALEAALDRLESARKHGEFLSEASESYCVATYGHSFSGQMSAEKLLRDAYDSVFRALVIVERAEPMIIEVPTEANARATLVRNIANALRQSGIEARASTGRVFESFKGTGRVPVLSDLTSFEQFLDALGIGEEMTEQSFSRFVRSALPEEKGG